MPFDLEGKGGHMDWHTGTIEGIEGATAKVGGKRPVFNWELLQFNIVNAGDGPLKIKVSVGDSDKIIIVPQNGNGSTNLPKFEDTGDTVINTDILDYSGVKPKAWCKLMFRANLKYVW